MYIRLRPLWDVVVHRLLACGPDDAEDGYLLATRLLTNSRHLNRDTDGHLLPQLQLALQAVHNLGVLHGDLRNQNILVEEGDPPLGGGRQKVWLIDFGNSSVNATQVEKDGEMSELSLLLRPAEG